MKDAQKAEFLLNLLTKQKENILKLPVSLKEADCTIARFYLLLMPLLTLVETENQDRAKELTTGFFDMLLNSEYSLNIKITG